ncbi:MAG TPA: SLBB domain-containing protein [Candidatus Methylacidiphilales bacterium]
MIPPTAARRAAALLAVALSVSILPLRAEDRPLTTATSDPGFPAGIVHLSHSVQPYSVALLDKVTLKRADGTTAVVPVSQEGKLDIDDSTSIQAAGLSPDALSAAVAKASKGTKVVHVEEFHTPRVTVLGEVYHQIHVEMTEGPMRVLDAVAAANGFTSIANNRRVKLLRENAGVTDIYELDLKAVLRGQKPEQNVLILPGDVITVPKNFL